MERSTLVVDRRDLEETGLVIADTQMTMSSLTFLWLSVVKAI